MRWVALAMAWAGLAHAQETKGFDMPLEGLSYETRISGPVADVWLTQTFVNRGETHLEAEYIFPLQEQAAVDDVVIRYGGEVIDADVMEKRAATKVFAAAREEGRVAGLTTQERPNVFSQAVTNIPPGATVTVDLHLVQPVERDGSKRELTLPLVVGPRFVPPGAPAAEVPKLPRKYAKSALRVEIEAHLDSGVGFREVTLPYHPTVGIVEDGRTASLRMVDVVPNRDVVLRWWTDPEQPEAAFLTDGEHAIVTFEGPIDPAREAEVPRELLWVVDRSCSMRGQPIQIVKDAMNGAIDGMDARDAFGIIAFSNTPQLLTGRIRPMNLVERQAAKANVASMYTDGGTYLDKAVVQALEIQRTTQRKRIVVLLTDGFIGIEREVFREVADRLGNAHVFAFGVGSAPNRYLLDELARVGGGKVTWLRADEDPKGAVRRFLSTIERPTLTDIEIDWGDYAATDVIPDPLPSLFAGAPMFVVAKVEDADGPITVRGRVGGGPWERVLEPVHVGEEGERSLAVTWARQRIGDLERLLWWGTDPEVRSEIIETSVAYQVLSRFTAFVGVSKQIVRDEDQALRTVQVAPAPPAGMVPSQVPGMGRGEIAVIDTSKLIDTESVSAGTVLTKDFSQSLPTGRSYQEAVGLQAGVTGGVNPNMAASRSNENTYAVGGAAATDPVTGTFGGEEIVVEGRAALIDTETANVGMTLTKDFLQKIPTGRSYQAVVRIVTVCQGGPLRQDDGMQDSPFLLDGMSVTDPVTGSFGANFNFEATMQTAQMFVSRMPEFGEPPPPGW